MPKEAITIADIAQRANVSIATVSRALRGTSYVTEEKRQAVLDAAAELNYQPNVFAQGLASGRSMAVGVLTQNFGTPFYDAILQGVVRGLRGTNYSPFFADGQWQPDVERDAITAMLLRKIDGLIIIGGFVTAEELNQFAAQMPLVVVARHLPELEGHCLYIDNVQAAYNATKHLIELGHRRIAHISGRADHPDAVDRQRGYMMAFEEAGITIHQELIVEGTFRRQSGVLAINTLLSQGISFSAIFAANDQMAYGVRLGLYRRGIRVPEDISLVGFDDESAAAFMLPPLTTVKQPAIELGMNAAQVILDRLNDKPVSIPQLKAELIVRESTKIHR